MTEKEKICFSKKMKVIQPLSAAVVKKLRSGVAVMDVVHCVEELVLNAIDAEATCIAVNLNLPLYQIQVIDNGCGIDLEQMKIIGTRYATSKCHSIEDLQNLKSGGFRGEALSSLKEISSVLMIESRCASSTDTYCKIFTQGNALDPKKSLNSRPSKGTSVSVYDFMYNLPVRKNCISTSLDLEECRRVLQSIALMHPAVSFTLKNEATGEMCLQLKKCSSLHHSFLQMFGRDKAKNLKNVVYQNGAYEITGCISTDCHVSKDLQFLYVNKRYVLRTKLHKLINSILNRVLSASQKLNVNRSSTAPDISSPSKNQCHCICALNISCPYDKYDIIFEPRKTMIEFSDWDSVMKIVEDALKNFLKKHNLSAEETRLNVIDSNRGEKIDPVNFNVQDCRQGLFSHVAHRSFNSNKIPAVKLNSDALQSDAGSVCSTPENQLNSSFGGKRNTLSSDETNITRNGLNTKDFWEESRICSDTDQPNVPFLNNKSTSENNSITKPKGDKFNIPHNTLFSTENPIMLRIPSKSTMSDLQTSGSSSNFQKLEEKIQTFFRKEKQHKTGNWFDRKNKACKSSDASKVSFENRSLEDSVVLNFDVDKYEDKLKRFSHKNFKDKSSQCPSVSHSQKTSESLFKNNHDFQEKLVVKKTKDKSLQCPSVSVEKSARVISRFEFRNESTVLPLKRLKSSNKRLKKESVLKSSIECYEKKTRCLLQESENFSENDQPIDLILNNNSSVEISSPLKLKEVEFDFSHRALFLTENPTLLQSPSKNTLSDLPINDNNSNFNKLGEEIQCSAKKMHQITKNKFYRKSEVYDRFNDASMENITLENSPVLNLNNNNNEAKFIEKSVASLEDKSLQCPSISYCHKSVESLLEHSNGIQERLVVKTTQDKYLQCPSISLEKPARVVSGFQFKEESTVLPLKLFKQSKKRLKKKSSPKPSVEDLVVFAENLLNDIDSDTESNVTKKRKASHSRFNKNSVADLSDQNEASTENIAHFSGVRDSSRESTYSHFNVINDKYNALKPLFHSSDMLDISGTDVSNLEPTFSLQTFVNTKNGKKCMKNFGVSTYLKNNGSSTRNELLYHREGNMDSYSSRSHATHLPALSPCKIPTEIIDCLKKIEDLPAFSPSKIPTEIMDCLEEIETKVCNFADRNTVPYNLSVIDSRENNFDSLKDFFPNSHTESFVNDEELMKCVQIECSSTPSLQHEKARNSLQPPSQLELNQPDTSILAADTEMCDVNFQSYPFTKSLSIEDLASNPNNDPQNCNYGIENEPNRVTNSFQPPSQLKLNKQPDTSVLTADTEMCDVNFQSYPFTKRLSIEDLASNPNNDPQNCNYGIENEPNRVTNSFQPPSQLKLNKQPDTSVVATDTEMCHVNFQSYPFTESLSIEDLAPNPNNDCSNCNYRNENEPNRESQELSMEPSSSDLSKEIFEATASDQEDTNSHSDSNVNIVLPPCSLGNENFNAGVLNNDSSSKESKSYSNWKLHSEPESKMKVYVDTVTGNSAYIAPKIGEHNINENVQSIEGIIKKSHFFLTHDYSPFVSETQTPQNNFKNNPSEVQNDLENFIETNEKHDWHKKWRSSEDHSKHDDNNIEKMLSEWDNPMFDIPYEGTSVSKNKISHNISQMYSFLNSYKFSMKTLDSLQVIGQVDCKFIACILKDFNENCRDKQLLALFDQHAVHERIRLEQLMEELYEIDETGEKSVRTVVINPPLEISFSDEEVRLLQSYHEKLHKIGIHLSMNSESQIYSVNSVPSCLVHKETSELRRSLSDSINILQNSATEWLYSLVKTRSIPQVLPKTLLSVLNYQACRGAVKFGDPLTLEQCNGLLKALSGCKLPFQCAHGRPSIAPILDLKKIETLYEKKSPPCLKALYDQMKQ